MEPSVPSHNDVHPTFLPRRIERPATGWAQGLTVAVAVLAFVYVLMRSVVVGPTYDEVSTILYWIPAPVIQVFNPADANNHLLNTLLIKLLFALGGESLFLARLPNVAAFAAYLVFGCLVARRIGGGLFGGAVILLLVANPFLLDFFGLARGYGIALGAQMASLYYVISFPVAARPVRTMTLSLVAAAMSVLAVYSWLHYYVAVGAVGLALSMVYRKSAAWRVCAITALVSGALALAIVFPILQLQRRHALFYGGQRGFYQDTLVSLAKYTAYEPVATRSVIVALNVVVAFVLGAVCFAIVRGSRGDRHLRAPLVAVIAVLGLAILSTVAQHYLLGSPFLIDRTALFFYPLIVLAVCLALRQSLPRPAATAAAVVLASAATINFVAHANLQKTAMWYFDAHSREILQAVNDAGAATGRIQGLEFAWPFEQSVRYELARGSFPFVEIVRPLDPVDQKDFNPAADYYIHLVEPLENFDYDPGAQKALARPRHLVKCFDAEATCLYRMRRDATPRGSF